jgi:signal transduction histidine kinase/ActR/RegA family two-component response regulator
MIISFLQNKLAGISISRKLYFTIGIMGLLVTVELCTLWFAVGTLSSVRAFVNGEGLWSKAQKDAVYNLVVYAHSHDEKDFQAFRNFLKVPQGDNITRLELGKAQPDLNIAREGFIKGRNIPADVDGMINLIRRFHNVSYLNRAILIWGTAEKNMEQLIAISDQLHQAIRSNKASQADVDQILVKANALNIEFTRLEDDFSFTLGEGARWLENIILRLLLTLSVTIATTSILITISVSRGIEKGVKAIIKGAELVSSGELNTRVTVYSRDEIGQLAISFNNMTETLADNLKSIKDLKATKDNLKREKERAEISEKSKQLFLAKMSHEIRTPMNGILGFARLLSESLQEKEQREYIHIIIKSGEDLLVILNDILDLSRMEAGKTIFESLPFNPADVVQTTILMVKGKASQKGISVRYVFDEKLPEAVVGDSVRLSQVLLNLVSNSLKFTSEGEIVISAKCLSETEEVVWLAFGVKDTGIGIPLDKQEKIFESFEQATNDTARKFGGTGLGLSIVKQLIQLQNGELSLTSTPGLGSDFQFRLPYTKYKEKAEKPADQDTVTQLPDGHGISILIAEDNVINQMLATKVLKKQGFDVEVAENGLTALNKYLEKDFDIILMDLQMPEMDGYEATKKIRALAGLKGKVPIVAMSAHTIKGEYEYCIDIGMNDFVSKPFNPRELYEKIFKYVGRGVVKV